MYDNLLVLVLKPMVTWGSHILGTLHITPGRLNGI